MHLMTAADRPHSAHSSTREKMLEHLFVGELCRCFWRQGARGIEVLRPEVDTGGYDLVLAADGVIRHVQLKSSHRQAKTRDTKININLAHKPSGCVLWIQFDPATMELGPFLWFGGTPNSPLPPLGDKVGKHTKADSTGQKGVRLNIRVLAKSQFTVLPDMDAVARALFGPPPAAA